MQTAAAGITSTTLKRQALEAGQVPNFFWIDQAAKVPTLGTYLADALATQTSTGQSQILQVVIYDLPNKNCASASSDAEFTVANNGLANYENFIETIVTQLKGGASLLLVACIF